MIDWSKMSPTERNERLWDELVKEGLLRKKAEEERDAAIRRADALMGSLKLAEADLASVKLDLRAFVAERDGCVEEIKRLQKQLEDLEAEFQDARRDVQ